MAKDREGHFHPKKGKPSGSKGEGSGLRPSVHPDELKQGTRTEVLDMDLGGDVHLMHPNRNTHKKRDNTKEFSADNDSDKTINQAFMEIDTDTEPVELPAMLTRTLLQELTDYSNDACITIYIPTHSKGMEVNDQFDIIACKNALQKAEQVLNERNTDPVLVKKLLKPGYDLLRNETFWHNLSNGLALFISDGYFRYSKLLFSPEEEVLVNHSFFTAPLAGALVTNEYFFLLVMSKKQAKLYRGDASGLEYLPIEELPNGIDDVVHFEEKDDQTLFRMGGRGGTGGANFHGIGSGKPDEKENIALYLNEVDKTIWKEVLHTENAPLLLAGIEYMIPIYRDVSNYKHLWPEAIVRGALEHEDQSELHTLAMEKMEPYFKQRADTALKEYFNKSATQLTSDIPAVIIPAAYYGRVEHLFVAKGSHIWGRFNEQDNQVYMNGEQKDGDDCLVNQAIMKTILGGGDVFLLPKEQMPDQHVMAAVMRYAAEV